jgi:hypothetical protein
MLINGKPWSMLRITPSELTNPTDEPADFEDRLRLLGYLLKGIDPAALVSTTSGCVPFADLLRFYLKCNVKPQGAIQGAKRSGRSNSLPTDRWQPGGTHKLAWIGRLNARRDEQFQLPGPEFVAERMGICSPGRDAREQHIRACAVDELRQDYLDEQQRRRWRAIARSVFKRAA